MKWKQDLTALESKNTHGIKITEALHGQHHFPPGGYFMISSHYGDFADDNSSPRLFFLGKLTKGLTMAHFQSVLNSETFRSPQVIRHLLRKAAIAEGILPVVEIAAGNVVYGLHVAFLFNSSDLFPYRTRLFGEKISAWMGNGELINAEFNEMGASDAELLEATNP